MANNKRVRVTSDIYGEKKPSVLEKMMPDQREQEKELDQPAQEENQEQKSKGRTLKQAMFSIGTARELKLDEIALAYNKHYHDLFLGVFHVYNVFDVLPPVFLETVHHQASFLACNKQR